jgi:hypothetical protein
MDSLEQLIHEALGIELRHRRGTGSVRRLITIKQVYHQSYHDPANWSPHRFIHLLHNDPAVGSLGYFQEFFHRGGARKLIPVAAEPPFYEIEIVSGGEWRGPQQCPLSDPPTAGEVAHIRAAWQPKSWHPAWKHLQRKRAAKLDPQKILSELFGIKA